MSLCLLAHPELKRDNMIFLKTTFAALIAISSAGYVQAQDSGAYGGLGASAYVTNPDGATFADLFAA